MSDVSVKERLQPSLLDRLADDDPHDRAPEPWFRIDMSRLRELVVRDLESLLNTANLESTLRSRARLRAARGRAVGVGTLEGHPEVRRSIVNYGLPDLAGMAAEGVSTRDVEAAVRDAIRAYEPRIISEGPDAVRVAVVKQQVAAGNALTLEIVGAIWGDPVPEPLHLRTRLDLDSGEVRVIESG